MRASATGALSELLQCNGLDYQIIYESGKLFDGFFFYEHFSDSNQARIDESGNKRILVSHLLAATASHASDRILNDPIPGRGGQNAAAIRFARFLAQRNERLYQTPLNNVIAIATNAIFGTSYAESDIANLLHR